MNEVAALLDRAVELRRAGRRLYGCLVVKARGSTPQSAGSLMLIDETAALYGTVGGGCVEAEVRRRAHELLGAGDTDVCDFKLDHDYGWDDGMICGGTLRIAIGSLPEVDSLEAIRADVAARRETALPVTAAGEAHVLDLPPAPRLVIAGAGHIGASVARQGVALGFDVTVIDDRADLLDHVAAEGATPVVGAVDELLAAVPIDGATYCVIVTRGHRHDARALGAVVDRGARYVGMIGSRRKVKLTFDELLERGVSQEALDVVHAPIGLDIGAVTVEEIALSISAQLVQARRSG